MIEKGLFLGGSGPSTRIHSLLDAMRQSSKLARLVYSAGCNQSARQLASKAVAQQVPKKETELVSSERLKNETITTPGQAFVGDLRSTSGLGLGDGLETHTSKWLQVCNLPTPIQLCPVPLHMLRCFTCSNDLQADVKTGNTKSPMEYIQEAPPIKVHGAVVASYGSELSDIAVIME